MNSHLLDREHGEWYWGLLPDGSPDTVSPKAGFWKCTYHNSRMCLEVLTHGAGLPGFANYSANFCPAFQAPPTTSPMDL